MADEKEGGQKAAPSTEEDARSFAVIFQAIARGKAHAEASKALHRVVKACQSDAALHRTTSRGTITVTLAIAAESDESATITYDIKEKTPGVRRERSTMFITEGGNLSVKNERQTDLGPQIVERQPARDVPAAPSAAKDA